MIFSTQYSEIENKNVYSLTFHYYFNLYHLIKIGLNYYVNIKMLNTYNLKRTCTNLHTF